MSKRVAIYIRVSTSKQTTDTLALFIEIAGDKPNATYTKADVRTFKDVLRRTKKSGYGRHGGARGRLHGYWVHDALEPVVS